jgi:hypothetical protein
MPQVFRAMRRDQDGLPIVARSATALGVRPGKDIDVDDLGNAVVNDKGMSVSPTWRDMSIFFIPNVSTREGRGATTRIVSSGETAHFSGRLLRPDSSSCPIVQHMALFAQRG